MGSIGSPRNELWSQNGSISTSIGKDCLRMKLAKL
jgi:hypothetical protein